MMNTKQPAVYIMTNKRHGTLYTGMTTNLVRRVYEHQHQLIDGFSAKYHCHVLAWYEIHETIENAVAREMQLKAGSRKKKLALIEQMNPEWHDLYPTLF